MNKFSWVLILITISNQSGFSKGLITQQIDHESAKRVVSTLAHSAAHSNISLPVLEELLDGNLQFDKINEFQSLQLEKEITFISNKLSKERGSII